ncbi:MAG: DNA polymerase I [Bacteroidales bacterium]|nr:DNA polymerase I [Bacteroidales bacterium]
MNRLFLIDGHALVFKMYYAFMRRPMINSKGEDTSILFGFTKYLLELIDREAPSHIAVMFDPPAKTFRHELFPEYKGTRQETPELVKSALVPLIEIIESLGIKVIMRPGFEADDVIGTLAVQFANDGCEVYMVTPDKDLGQIVDNHIFQYKPGKAGADNEILSKADICAKYNITDPKQVIDILTLWGDASDNVPGVRGVGEVGARKLIEKFGSVANIYSRLGELSAKQQEAFREAEPHIAMSKTLVTIKTDIDLGIDFDSLVCHISNSEKATKLFTDYEMKSLMHFIQGSSDGSSKKGEEKKTIEGIEKPVEEICRKASATGEISLNVSDKIVAAIGNEYAIASFSDLSIRKILEDENIAKIGHGLKPFVNLLSDNGIDFKGDLYDIEIMHYLLNPERSHKLDFLTLGYLGADIDAKDAPKQVTVTQGDLFSAPMEAKVETGNGQMRHIREAVAAAALYPIIRKELEVQNMMNLYLKIEMPLIYVLADMERTGVKIDTAQLADYGRELKMKLSEIEDSARAVAGMADLNLSSPKQVGVVIYEKFQLNPKVKKNIHDSYPTDEETLLELPKHQFVDLLLEFRGIKKLLSTYIEPLPALISPKTKKIHTTYNQALTATGRLSSIKPNLQNIPIRTELGREIRKTFIPSSPDGYIVSADYSQIELRLMAHLSKDEGMIADFLRGDDIHAATASKIFKVPVDEVTKEQRRRAKTANFGIIYGISAFGLSQRLGIPRGESKELIDSYFKNFPGVVGYINGVIASAQKKGYVETMFARKRYLPDINAKNQTIKKLAERNAINAPIQGSAADIIKLAMNGVYDRMRKEGMKSKMILQVHDELVIDVVPSELESVMKLVKEEMEKVCSISVPLTADCNYGKNWLEAH